MSDERFIRKGFDQRLSKAIEECGEFLAAAGKTQRFGRDSTNPLLPKEQQETNIVWLMREMDDASNALSALRVAIVTDEDAP